jgi:hypothetical protein
MHSQLYLQVCGQVLPLVGQADEQPEARPQALYADTHGQVG